MTKEQVLEKAKELGLTLTDEQVEQYVKDGKLPEKEDDLEKADLKELLTMIKDLRKENAERRVTNKKYEEKLKDLDKQKEKDKQTALEEQGKYKELYEAELAKSTKYEPIVNEYTEYQNKKREQYKKDFGDTWIESFSSTPLSELEVLHSKLTKSKEETNTSNHRSNDRKTDSKPLINYTSMK